MSLVSFNDSQIKLIQDTICKGSTDEEFKLFLHVCQKSGLDPMLKQIFSIKRGNQRTIQTSIDGLRLIAERTGKYSPGRESSFTYDEKKALVSATAYVKKMTPDGTWHEVASTAFMKEYNPGQGLWQKLPHVMLSKCYDSDTYVLTTEGFQRFDSITGKVLQVTDLGLEETNSVPFFQNYDGPMVSYENRWMDFCVTPNHDMVTTDGKIEAQEIYENSRKRPQYFLPRCISGSKEEYNISDRQIILAAACVCDGTMTMQSTFRISVCKQRKIEKLKSLGGNTGCYFTDKKESDLGSLTVTNMTFKKEEIFFLVNSDKTIKIDVLLQMSMRQLRLFVDTMIFFDGSRKGGYIRWSSSNTQHVRAFEIAAVGAGYSVSTNKPNYSSFTDKPCYQLSITDNSLMGIIRHGRKIKNRNHNPKNVGLKLTHNSSGKVWCVTVPSGVIIVKRLGHSMLCGNCAEANALRRAFPAEMCGLYAEDEMKQAEVDVEIIDSVITEDQCKRIRESLPQERMEGFLKYLEKIGYTKIEDIKVKDYQKLLGMIESSNKNV